ncbi:MAG: phosphoribosylformylglycinamidine synthase [Clostridia bacterium]
MVYRIFVEKQPEFRQNANLLKTQICSLLGQELTDLRIVNRYDIEGISQETLSQVAYTVFAEPQTDILSYDLNLSQASYVLAVQYLDGQFDQRADSAMQCVQIVTGTIPVVRVAKVYLFYGKLSSQQIKDIKQYLINPVECEETSLTIPTTLSLVHPKVEKVEVVDGFCDFTSQQLADYVKQNNLAMDLADAKCCQDYFKSLSRCPTITEIKLLDTYWSDHCRHTTFFTTIDSVDFVNPLSKQTYELYLDLNKRFSPTKAVTLMNIATIAVKKLKSDGVLTRLDESSEINACTVKVDVDVDGKNQEWLLLFKNETHNHPTEIEPFGGAATCIGGAIRDPLSGRAYVFAAMRVSGAGNPLVSISKTLSGKLPQSKIVTSSASGYSSYGNQIGLATGLVDEIYHQGYVAKRMEIGAVLGAVKASNVVRECPIPGDVVILLGGKTGRDGCGGATGSSKSHTTSSLSICGAEVQKGNAPEERKLQRLFRNPVASKLIKRCNDFGAGGVAVAIGELADGLDIDLDKVPKKYDGLSGTELAISESQERMAVVVSKEKAQQFILLASQENILATAVAVVTQKPSLVMRFCGQTIVDISREMLDSNGAKKHTSAKCLAPLNFDKVIPTDFVKGYKSLSEDLNVCSKRGLIQLFDSTNGSGEVLFPLGGITQSTPSQAMAYKFPLVSGKTNTVATMAYGFNPYITDKDCYRGAYLAVVESICKLIALGSGHNQIYLTFQEYFEKLLNDPKRWGKPLEALLGALQAQLDFDIGAIGGKDSMSGSFEQLSVPSTLVSFACSTDIIDNILSPEFKAEGHSVILLSPEYADGLPNRESLKQIFATIKNLCRQKQILSMYACGFGGVAEAVLKMCLGNNIGFEYSSSIDMSQIFKYSYGSFVIELASEQDIGKLLGKTIKENIIYKQQRIPLDELRRIYQAKLEPIYPTSAKFDQAPVEKISYSSSSRIASLTKFASPKVIIPVFPGTNCEYDTARAFERAGATVETFVINNLTPQDIASSAKQFAKLISNSQIVALSGGFSAGDEPDGAGKFITAFMRNPDIAEQINKLLTIRKGLMCGICNGFQALIKLGLVPYGKIVLPTKDSPTLTSNDILRHQSRIVQVRIASTLSPWLSKAEVGEIYSVPISHGEGKFIANQQTLSNLIKQGQICTQYVDLSGTPSMNTEFNPNGSVLAVEGITSPDGLVLGKMGHVERYEKGLYKNISGNFDLKLFDGAVEYFK